MQDQPSASDIQLAFYARGGADKLDPAAGAKAEHDLALSLLMGFLSWAPVNSLLDVGAGTGRTLARIHERYPHIALKGIEPSPDLRNHSVTRWGLQAGQVSDGDATNMPFADKSFDLVCSFGILHHIKDHARAVAEMARVAKTAVFISDVNCYGQGSKPLRTVKQILRTLGLWSTANLIRSRGKGYFVSEGDGLYYSYSLIDDLPILYERFPHVILSNPTDRSTNHYRDSPFLVAIAHNEKP
jgi:SAM-dependent methyltransferase